MDIKELNKLIKDWERFSEKYRKLALEADDNPVKQEGLFCRAEVYCYCIYQLQECLKQKEK